MGRIRSFKESHCANCRFGAPQQLFIGYDITANVLPHLCKWARNMQFICKSSR